MKPACIKSLAWLLPAFSLAAQDYAIDWSKIAGGSGTSSNAQFVLSGTIGQADASGALTNGQYSVSGGFWSLIALQTASVPSLSIQLTTMNTVVVSWPSSGYSLQQNSDLNVDNWTNVLQAVTDDGIHKSITVNLPAETRFYRLKQP